MQKVDMIIPNFDVSSGHNFRGRPNHSPGDSPMNAVNSILCVEGNRVWKGTPLQTGLAEHSGTEFGQKLQCSRYRRGNRDSFAPALVGCTDLESLLPYEAKARIVVRDCWIDVVAER